MTNNTHDADVAFIRALAELLNDNDLTELQVKRDYGEDDSLNVRVSRKPPQQIVAPQQMQTAPPALAPPPPMQVHSSAAAPAGGSGGEDDPANHPGAVVSPMVGTVYMQAEPGAPAFVAVGKAVSEGETLLIVEAMKTMNHIPAPHAGTVKRILVGDGDAVEFGAPLVIIE